VNRAARRPRALLALALLAFVQAAALGLAQDGRIDLVSGDEVVFVVTPDDLAAAVACPGCGYVESEPGVPVVLRVVRQNPNRLYTLEVSETGWNPPSTLEIEVRHIVTSADGSEVFFTTEWRSLRDVPTIVFRQSDVGRAPQVRVEASYRLRLWGDEPAGTYLASVVHRIRESGSAASHAVRATLPAFLLLRLVAREDSASPAHDVRFDYASAPAAYLQALTAGRSLAPTGGDLARVEVSTNHAGGFTVSAAVEELQSPTGAPLVAPRLLLHGERADGRSFRLDGPTSGFATLLLAEDYAFEPSGNVPPGAYGLLVTYRATLDP
jgi:hypothetical protein